MIINIIIIIINNNNNNGINIEEINNDNIKEGNICIICRLEKPNISFGCGHSCYCSKRFDKKEIKNRKECPTCKHEIKCHFTIIPMNK